MPSSTSSSDGARRFLLRLGCFLAVTVGLFVALELAMRAWVAGDIYAIKYASAFRPAPPERMLVLGASPALQGIHPRYLEEAGLSVYNFAYSGGNPAFFRAWYAIYRQHNPAPRRVVYATDWFMFRRGFLGRSIASDAEFLPLGAYVQLFAKPGISWASLTMNRLALIKHRVRLKNLLFLQTSDDLASAHYKGCVTHTGRYQGKNPMSAETDPGMIAEFDALLDTFAADGVEVIFVQPPSYLPDTGEHPDDQARLAAIARTRGIPLLNYNGDRASAFNRERKNFNNWVHPSRIGAERFSRRLAQDLRPLVAARP